MKLEGGNDDVETEVNGHTAGLCLKIGEGEEVHFVDLKKEKKGGKVAKMNPKKNKVMNKKTREQNSRSPKRAKRGWGI